VLDLFNVMKELSKARSMKHGLRIFGWMSCQRG